MKQSPATPLARPPWHFRLAKWLLRHGYRGGYRTIELGERLGWLDAIVRYRLSERVSLDVPLYRRENQWDEQDVREYEADLLRTVAAAVADWPAPATLVDCGADIGIFAALLAARCPQFERVIAFEPNPAAFSLLAANVARLPLAGEAYCEALSDASGRGRLARPAWDASDHARFLEPAADGDLAVRAIDELGLDPGSGLVLKIDVEGGELAVLRGARRTLAASRRFVVAFEAHPLVCERTSVDPAECLKLLASIRPVTARVAEFPDLVWDADSPLFECLPRRQICNVVCRSVEAR